MLRLLALLACARALHPPPDVSTISASTFSGSCAADAPAPLLALVLVMSHPHNVERRARARAAYPSNELATLRVRRLFVVGDAPDVDVSEEDVQHEDLLRLGHVERYRDLALKCLAAFTWALDHCAHARFVVKADDDAFIEYYALTRHLDGVDGDDERVFGQLIHDFEPTRARGRKHALEFSEFPAHIFPTFASGLLYATPTRSLRLLVAAARSSPYLPVEDVYFTGVLAEVAHVRRVHYPGVDRRAQVLGCCQRDEQVYECQRAVLQEIDEVVTSERALKYKAHGRYCFEHACARYSSSGADQPDVECF